jgi:SAM-dependent methyltransferase
VDGRRQQRLVFGEDAEQYHRARPSWEPPVGEIFDLVTCAQAWHWIDRERGTRQAERLLRSGGWLAIFGRRPDEADTPLRRQIDAAYAQLAPELAPGRPAPAEPLAPGAAFEPPLVRRYAGVEEYPTAAWVELLRTHSDHRLLEPDRRERLLESVAAAIERHGGVYAHRSVTHLWAARRR